LEGKDVKDLLLNVGSGGGAASAPTGAAGGAAGGEAAAEEKEEEKEEGELYISNYTGYGMLTSLVEKEESDEDMGFGLFD
jgi:large subunit ribosomal protein LP1